MLRKLPSKPCIRNIEAFRKTGCPENNSCSAWISTLGNLNPKIINKCADIAIVGLLWDLNCNVIGTQVATESFRNGMCEVVNGQVVPKKNEIVIRIEDLLGATKEMLSNRAPNIAALPDGEKQNGK